MIADLKIRDIQEYIMDNKVDIFIGIRLISVYSKKEPSYRLQLDEPNEDKFEYQVAIDPPISGVQVQELRIEDLQ
jgi:hypothetical protein